MKSQEEKIRRMLDEFGRALIDAVGSSTKMSEAFYRLRDKGYALHLILGCLPERPPASPAPGAELDGADPISEAKPRLAAPSFRVNTDDVAFLKSIGIDPTRTVRRRRKPRSTV